MQMCFITYHYENQGGDMCLPYIVMQNSNNMPKKIKQGWFFKIEKSFIFLLMYYWLAFIKKIKQGWFFIFEKSFRLWNTNLLLVSI